MPEKQSKCPFQHIDNIKEFDALDPAAREDPLPFYDWLRTIPGNTIYKLPHEENFYVVHRYEDVKNIFNDTENFSSKIVPVRHAAFPALADGPDHARVRNVMTALFHQKNVLVYENEIKKFIIQSTSEISGGQTSELFESWANVIPLAGVSLLFGFDTSREALHNLHTGSIAINRALFVTGGTGPRRSMQPTFTEKIKIALAVLLNSRKLLQLKKHVGRSGMKELSQMLSITDKNIAVPRPTFECIPDAIGPLLDLMLLFAKPLSDKQNKNTSIQILKHAIDNGQVSKMEMIMTGAFIFFAGYETTSSLLSNCVVHLCRHPELFQQLKSDPSRLEPFIEEALRYYTPVGRFLRRAQHDVVFSGTTLPKNSIVILLTGAANTDPEKFTQGCAFDIERNNNRQHLSFGKGAHFCVGASLARMQVTLALQELIQNASSIELIEEEKMKMVTDRDNGILRYEKVFIKVN